MYFLGSGEMVVSRTGQKASPNLNVPSGSRLERGRTTGTQLVEVTNGTERLELVCNELKKMMASRVPTTCGTPLKALASEKPKGEGDKRGSISSSRDSGLSCLPSSGSSSMKGSRYSITSYDSGHASQSLAGKSETGTKEANQPGYLRSTVSSRAKEQYPSRTERTAVSQSEKHNVCCSVQPNLKGSLTERRLVRERQKLDFYYRCAAVKTFNEGQEGGKKLLRGPLLEGKQVLQQCAVGRDVLKLGFLQHYQERGEQLLQQYLAEEAALRTKFVGDGSLLLGIYIDAESRFLDACIELGKECQEACQVIWGYTGQVILEEQIQTRGNG